MTPTQCVALFVRLFAIWLAFLAIQALGSGLAVGRYDPNGHALGPYVLALVWFAAAALLWRFPMFVAHRLVRPVSAKEGAPATAVEIAAVACIVLGLWLCVARAFPSFIRYLTVMAVMIHEDIPLSSLDSKTSALLIESGIEFAAALALVFRSRAIATYLLARPNK